jgi:hypothetical protein
MSIEEQAMRLQRIHQAVLLAFGAAAIVVDQRGSGADEAETLKLMTDPADWAAAHLAPLDPLSPFEVAFLIREMLVAATSSTKLAIASGAITAVMSAQQTARGEG